MPTWYGNVCSSGAVSRREQPRDPRQSAAEMERRAAERSSDFRAYSEACSDSVSGRLAASGALRGRRL